MDEYKEIPYIRLNATQKDKALDILRRGNRLLKKWAAFFPAKKFRQFRNLILDGNRNPVMEGTDKAKHVIPKERLTEFHLELPHILVIRNYSDPDLNNRTVERAVLENFAALAKKHARKWTIEGNPHGVTHRDYLQEAYMTVIEAMYQYTRDDIEISTFVWVALKNRMINVTNQQGNMLCPLTNADLELMGRYEQAKRGFNQPVTFDYIVSTLGLSEDDAKHLNILLTRVYSENQLAMTRGEGEVAANQEDQSGNDYTGHRVGVQHESEVVLIEQQDHVNSILRRAGLTSLERKVIEASMDPFYGWMTEFAKNHVNPQTGQPYTRMRITQVFNSAKEKVAKVIHAESQPSLV